MFDDCGTSSYFRSKCRHREGTKEEIKAWSEAVGEKQIRRHHRHEKKTVTFQYFGKLLLSRTVHKKNWQNSRKIHYVLLGWRWDIKCPQKKKRQRERQPNWLDVPKTAQNEEKLPPKKSYATKWLKWLNRSANQSISQSANKSVRSVNQSISQPVNKSVNRSISQSVNQSISQSAK